MPFRRGSNEYYKQEISPARKMLQKIRSSNSRKSLQKSPNELEEERKTPEKERKSLLKDQETPELDKKDSNRFFSDDKEEDS